ncbi:hypothetical protein [Pedobacter frigoris]|uniref:hypothetical protein n=1 Tax=Pedobacter frigoris TaxID=2571272 RepID=UPI00293061C6|nr:hypothetical protein [Pedobacter frigoris]
MEKSIEQLSLLKDFFQKILSDPRIGASHISVFCALVQMAADTDSNPVLLRSYEVMEASKILGLATYHRCIKDLHEQGYLRYSPSYNHRKKSRFYLSC